MIFNRDEWSANPSDSAVRVTCQPCFSSAARTIWRSAWAFNAFNVPGAAAGSGDVVAILVSSNLWRSIGHVDDGRIGRDHHPLQAVSKFANVVLPPIARGQKRESLRRNGLRPDAEPLGDRPK